MADLFAAAGLPGLFLLSFLAATLLPLGSEWLLVLLLLRGEDPLWPIAVAAIGNTLGACTTYAIGIMGAGWLIERVLRINQNARDRAERFFSRFGSWALLLSWLPVLGDPLCLAGGVLRVPFCRFLVFVFAGKLARYIGVAVLTLEGSRHLA